MGETIPLNIALQALTKPLPTANSGTITLPVLLTSLPPTLNDVTRPLSINGTLIGLLANNKSADVTMRTSMGLVQFALADVQSDMLKTLSSMLKTPTGQSPLVDLFIQTGAPPQKATLVFQLRETPSKTENTQQPLFGKVDPSAQQQPLAQGQTVKATLLPTGEKTSFIPQNISQNVPQQGQNMPVQSSQTASLTQIAHDLSTNQPDKTSPVPAATAQTASASQQTTPSNHKIHIQQLFAPEADWPETIAPDQMKSTVTGKTNAGFPVIESQGKVFVMQERSDTPIGTKLLITVAPDALLDDTVLLPVSKDRDFALLRELVSTLEQLDPSLAKNFVATRIPQPQQNFAGTVLFFLSALQSGKMDEWFTFPVSDKLEKSGKGHAKAAVADALKEALSAPPSSDARVGEWQSYPIPLHAGQSFEMLRLYVHRDAPDQAGTEAAEAKEKKTRFVINITMSRLGPIQLDGLSQKKQLDLVVRSERELPHSLTHDIRETALPALEAVGLIGTILFQTGRGNWVNISTKNTTDAESRNRLV